MKITQIGCKSSPRTSIKHLDNVCTFSFSIHNAVQCYSYGKSNMRQSNKSCWETRSDFHLLVVQSPSTETVYLSEEIFQIRREKLAKFAHHWSRSFSNCGFTYRSFCLSSHIDIYLAFPSCVYIANDKASWSERLGKTVGVCWLYFSHKVSDLWGDSLWERLNTTPPWATCISFVLDLPVTISLDIYCAWAFWDSLHFFHYIFVRLHSFNKTRFN